MPTYPGLAVYGGDIVSADDVNANIPVVYVKANSDSRPSTTTLAADPELTGIPLGVGVWSIELNMAFNENSSTLAIKTQWAFTGTWNNPVRFCSGPGDGTVGGTNAGPTGLNYSSFVGAAANANVVYSSAAAGGVYCIVREVANNVVVTAAGTLSLQWAQNVSNATAAIVNPGTSFTIRQISE